MTVVDRYGESRLAELRLKAGLPDIRELRAPIASTKTIGWTSPGQPMAAEWDAETSIRWGYMANVIAYRCIQIRARALMGCPFRVGDQPPERPGQTVPYNTGAPLARLLGPPPGGPAPKLTARRLFGWSAVQRIATGRHGWEIEAAPNGTPVALWPLVASQLEPVPSTGGAAWWDGFYYGHGDQRRRLTADQVLYGWDPSATDFRQAESALQAARLDLSVAVMGDRYSAAFLKNDARPAAIIVHEAFQDDDEYVAWKRQFLAEHQGPDNAGRIAFAEAEGGGDKGVSGSIDVKVLGLSQKDAQFVETHQASLSRVAMALGVPWSRLDASGRTFDNASEEDEIFWMDQWAFSSDLADEINMQLAPRLGGQVGWFDMSHVRIFHPAPKFTKIDAAAMLDRQVVVPNDVRPELGLQPIDGGDDPITPPAVAPVVPPVTVAPPAPAALPPAPTPARARPAPERRAMTADQMEQRRAGIWRRADATVRTIEARWRRAFAALFAKQEKATLSRLEGNRGRKVTGQRATPDEVFDRQHWTQETADVAEALYELVIATGFARVSDMFGIDFDLEAPFAQEYLRNRVNQLAGQVTDTTYQAITDALSAGVAEGEGIPDLAARVSHVFDVATKSRSVTIARTEVISAYNGSATLAAQQLPADVAAGREWIATRDGRTRDDHAAADGDVVAMDAPFSVGGESLLYPGDPGGDPANTVNCRCTVAILTPADMADRTARGEQRIPVEHAVGIYAARLGFEFNEPVVRRALEVAA